LLRLAERTKPGRAPTPIMDEAVVAQRAASQVCRSRMPTISDDVPYKLLRAEYFEDQLALRVPRVGELVYGAPAALSL